MRLKSQTLVAAIAVLGIAQPSSAIELDFGGFISVGGGILSNDEIDSSVQYDEDFSFDEDSILGLQTTAPINDKLSFTAQLVARGNDSFNIEAEWAFFTV